jgi:hypothetical protein
MLKKLVWNEEESTIRGGFVNLCITTIYMILIILGSIFSFLASNLREMETLLIGIFVSSFGLWAGKKTVEFVKKTGISNVLSKYGMNMDDLPEVGEVMKTYRQNGSSIKVDQDAEQRARERAEAK